MTDLYADRAYANKLLVSIRANLDTVDTYRTLNNDRLLLALGAMPLERLEALNAMLERLLVEYESLVNPSVYIRHDHSDSKAD